MKIYIDKTRIKQKYFDEIVAKFNNVTLTNVIEDSYDCDAIVVGPEFVTSPNIAKYPKLKWIQLLTAGFNTIDLKMLKESNIVLTNAKGVYSITIAEDVFTKILMINRNVKHYLDNMKEGKWSPIHYEKEIWGSTVGVLGTGSIATEIAKRMKAFEAKVIGYNRSLNKEEYFDEVYSNIDGLKTVLSNSDYVIIALPLNEATNSLINYEMMSYMKSDAVLVNIARGEIVNQDDLIRVLKERKIRAAALDVTTPEPLPKESELWYLDNVYITPHNSPSSPYLTSRLLGLINKNLELYINNQPLTNKVSL
jgi:phosphoglycerate dehydrogenase-like enzyme